MDTLDLYLLGALVTMFIVALAFFAWGYCEHRDSKEREEIILILRQHVEARDIVIGNLKMQLRIHQLASPDELN